MSGREGEWRVVSGVKMSDNNIQWAVQAIDLITPNIQDTWGQIDN